MKRSTSRLTWTLLLGLVGASGTRLMANPVEFVEVFPSSEGTQAVLLDLDQAKPPRLEEISRALKAQGHEASPESLARMLARKPADVQGDSVLSFEYVPTQAYTARGTTYPSSPRVSPQMTASAPSAQAQGFLIFLQALLTLFTVFPQAQAGTNYAGSYSGGYSGATLYPPGYSPGSYPTYTTSSASTGYVGGLPSGSLFGQDYEGRDESNEPTPVDDGFQGGTMTNPAGSFFKSLPLPAGSWRVGPNGHFWDCRSSCGRPHHGNDLHAKAGTPVFSVADGVVTRVKYNGGGYHWYIVIKHDAVGPSGRHYNTLYGHIEVGSGIKEGTRVRAGQQIATVSAKEVSSPHCHFEVLRDDGSWKGVPLNPNAFARFHAESDKAQVAYTRSQPPLGRGVA